MTILFVCTGNTCRSPLAVAAWRALQERGEVPSGWSAFSAGLAACEGEPATRHAADIAREWGADLSEHRARHVDVGALRHVDVCVALAPSHEQALQQMIVRGGARRTRVLCLSDFAERVLPDKSLRLLLGAPSGAGARLEPVEIADPYGGSREAYDECAARIEGAVSRLARHLMEQSGADASSSSGSEFPGY